MADRETPKKAREESNIKKRDFLVHEAPITAGSGEGRCMQPYCLSLTCEVPNFCQFLYLVYQWTNTRLMVVISEDTYRIVFSKIMYRIVYRIVKYN